MTYRQIIYMCLDQLKLSSDDAYYTEDHILFLISKLRNFLLKQKYSDVKKEIPESNYQTICLDLEFTPVSEDKHCEGKGLIKSKQKVPTLLTIGHIQVYPISYYPCEIALISKERMKYVGFNKWLKNIVYASIGPDNYLYLKSSKGNFLFPDTDGNPTLKSVHMTGIFESPEKASELDCNNEVQDILDKDFPMEDGLTTQLLQLLIQLLTGATQRPEDPNNNANDDLSDIASYLRSMLQPRYQRNIYNNEE